MAIVQISRIQNRRGLKSDLPQLASGELGWSIDTGQLYIGHGTIAEGASEVGNTEILTTNTDVFSLISSYTYKGNQSLAVTTGASANAPISRTIQQKQDDFASVKDFGANGDGVTDDTAAINRAIKELASSTTTASRKLYMPAGTYLISSPVKLFPNTNLIGEGREATIIRLDTSGQTAVVQTADMGGNVTTNIGNDSNETPHHIHVEGVTFESTVIATNLLLDRTRDSDFINCGFKSIYTNQTGIGTSTACVKINCTAALPVTNVNFTNCLFEGNNFGVNADNDSDNVRFTNCEFHDMYMGVKLAESADGSTAALVTGPEYYKFVGCYFDDIDVQAARIYANGGTSVGHVFAFCTFDDVGTNNDGTSDVDVLTFTQAGNFATNNHFVRTDRSDVGGVAHFTTAQETVTLADNTGSATNTGISFDVTRENALILQYNMSMGSNLRTGTLTISANGTSADVSDDYVENGSTSLGAVFTVTTGGVIQFTTTSTGTDRTMHYNIKYLV